MAKKHKLSPALSYDYSVVGIVSTLRDFRFCHFVNEVLNIKLSRNVDIPVNVQGSDQLFYFPFYRFYDVSYKINWYLMANKNHQQQWMLAGLKQLNFFLVNDGIPSFMQLSGFVASIKKIPHVLMAQELDLNKAKKLNYLLEDLEMHILELDRKK
jgi:hypothetical protein